MTPAEHGWPDAHVWSFEAVGITHVVATKGAGPTVVLLPEMNGPTPLVLAFADRLVQAGFCVTVPAVTGELGRPATPGYAARQVLQVCVSRELRAFARREHRPLADWVRALARHLLAERGGRGVGVIGLCLTGGFALAAAAEEAVLAPVAAEPSLPFAIGRRRRGDPGVSDRELERVAERVRDEGLCLLGLRFSADCLCPPSRVATIEAALGDGLRVIQIDSGRGNLHGLSRRAHAVLTADRVDEPGHPTLAAEAEVVAFLHDRLTGG